MNILFHMKNLVLKKALNLNLKPIEERTETINLEEEYGTVKIISQPEAEIWINGKLSGQTPKLVKLRTINRLLKLKKTSGL